jgi:Zn-dependent protease with chaperone function
VSPSARAARRWSAQLYALVLALGAGGLLAAAFSLVTGIGRVSVDRHSPRDLDVLGLTLSYPYANAPAIVLVALAAVGALVLAGGCRATLRLLTGHRRFRARMGAMALRRDGDTFVFDDPAPQAFCAGLLRPRIYLSSGAVAALDAEALDAVIAHERCHRDRRDPMRVLLATALSEALFFLPVVTRLRDRFVAVLELDADDAAIAAGGGNPAALAAAMVLFDASASPAGAMGIAPERVDHLLGRPAPWRLPSWQVAIGALTVTAILVASWAAGQHALVRTSLAVPGLSRQPCVLVLASIPGLLAAMTIAWLRHRTSERLGGLDQPRH